MDNVINTIQLKEHPADGTLFVGYGGRSFSYWGMTEQADGSQLVELEWADGGCGSLFVEVDARDMADPEWEV